MLKRIPEQELDAILTVVAAHPEGVLVTITGKGNLVSGSAIVEGRGEVYVPLSPEAEAVKQAIRAPIRERQPVGYRARLPR